MLMVQFMMLKYKYKEQLPKWQDRRGNNAFVAVKLKNIPKERYSAEMSVRSRLSLLEKQMAEILTSKLSYAATAVVGGAPAAERGHRTRNRPIVNRYIELITTIRSQDCLVNKQMQTASSDRCKPPADGSEVNSNGDVEDGVQTVGGNFTTVTNRRCKKTVVYGNANDDTFTAGLQKHELFVFQVNKNVTEDQVKDYISKKNVTVVSIKLMTAAEAPSNSYHVVIHCMDVRPIMKPEFWPTGVGCRRFRKKQQWSNSKQ